MSGGRIYNLSCDHDTVARIEPFRTSVAEMLLDGRLTVPTEAVKRTLHP